MPFPTIDDDARAASIQTGLDAFLAFTYGREPVPVLVTALLAEVAHLSARLETPIETEVLVARLRAQIAGRRAAPAGQVLERGGVRTTVVL